MRRSVETVVVLAIMAVVLHFFLVLGLIVPVIITSGSMATRFLGTHRHVVCHDCKQPFDVGEEVLPKDLLAVCPNCGSSKNPLEELAPRIGHRLLVNRMAFVQRRPRRWEAIVFDCPQKPGELCIKRVVGLPGELLQIRDGNLYLGKLVDGKFQGEIVRKPLEVLRELSLVVHDDQYQGKDEAKRWHTVGDWLMYEHLAPVYGRYAAPTVGPIMDDVGYNQIESRLLMPAMDLMLRLEGQATDKAPVGFRIRSGGIEYEVRVNSSAGSGELSEDGHRIAQFTVPVGSLERPSLVEFAVADQQAIFAIDGKVLLSEPLSKQPSPHVAEISPVGHTAKFASTHSVVLRDGYYTGGFGQLTTFKNPTPYQVGDDEYFVLGDNSPLSEDNRTWPPTNAPAELLDDDPLLSDSPPNRFYGVPAKSIVGNVLGKW